MESLLLLLQRLQRACHILDLETRREPFTNMADPLLFWSQPPGGQRSFMCLCAGCFQSGSTGAQRGLQQLQDSSRTPAPIMLCRSRRSCTHGAGFRGDPAAGHGCVRACARACYLAVGFGGGVLGYVQTCWRCGATSGSVQREQKS